MGEVERTILREKLRLLASYAAVIRARLPPTAQALGGDFFLQLGILHALQLAAQAVIDVALHIGAAEGRPAPDDAREAIRDLGTLGVVSRELAGRLAPIAGLRNVIVHEYARVDIGLVHAACTSELDDLDAFAAAVAARYSL
jgi:uncharacterized protein YutE (UPF0331/DUF86 family)